MFWDTEAMAAAAKLAEDRFGPQGQYVIGGDERFLSVRLYSETAGVFWYGDLRGSVDQNKLNTLAHDVTEAVYVIPEADYHDNRPYRDQAIARSTPD